MARDYYEVLGVGRDADADALQRAYRSLARKHHPDIAKDPGSEDRFKEINEAYQVLSDPQTRARYDRWGPDFRQYPEDAERAPGGGQAFRYGSSGGYGSSGMDVEDLFSSLFGGRGGGSMPGADQEAELVLTVEEAYTGGRRRLSFGDRELEVTIPAGVTDGQRIRLAGEGGRGGRGGPAGDLYLVVRLAPHPKYEVRGRDIFVPLPVTPWEAVLGAKALVDTPGGEVKVNVPAGSSTGRRLRLKGQGLPNPKGRPGDLYAQIEVMVPPKPTKEEKELFEQLARVSTFDPRKADR
ncbi:MAG: DnaJ-class molecular chaperone with C-terminal Zn finger domain [Frankiales bacterium]|nr:DnaJ-class molecular chaperone with C-terminal Zn finger domain [Frankiales bacterium]